MVLLSIRARVIYVGDHLASEVDRRL